VKYWEIIARNLKKRGWSLGYVSAVDSQGRTIWIADAHRDDGKRFVVRADEMLAAFVKLEAASVLGAIVLDKRRDFFITRRLGDFYGGERRSEPACGRRRRVSH
jgi:hypothetical protein